MDNMDPKESLNQRIADVNILSDASLYNITLADVLIKQFDEVNNKEDKKNIQNE